MTLLLESPARRDSSKINMHKGIILLVKASNRELAEARAEEFLEPFGDSKVWDWYQIGGRWTGTLTGYNPAKDKRNIEKCELCNGTGTRTDGLNGEGGCNGCDGKGKRLVWPTNFAKVECNCVPATRVKVEKVIREWAKDWEETRLADIKKGKENFKGDKGMQAYFLRRESEVLGDEFSFESNVYDTHKETNAVPDDLNGYYAVMMDLHN